MRRLLFLCILSLFAMNIHAQAKTIKTIKAIAFQEKIQTLDNALILDCSSLEAYQHEHIDGAILIETSETMKSILSDLAKDTPLLLYCKYGDRSKSASKKIEALGFKKIYQLKKGLVAWKRKGLATTKN